MNSAKLRSRRWRLRHARTRRDRRRRWRWLLVHAAGCLAYRHARHGCFSANRLDYDETWPRECLALGVRIPRSLVARWHTELAPPPCAPDANC